MKNEIKTKFWIEGKLNPQNCLSLLADDSYLRTEGKAPKLGKTGCRKFY